MPSLFELAGKVGTHPDDSDEIRLLKALMVLWTASMSTLAWIWGAIYFCYDEILPASIPWGYAVLSYVSIGLFAVIKQYRLFRLGQMVLSILLPFLLSLSLGGFAPSSAVILWALMGPLGAIVLYDRRSAVGWSLLYIALLCVSLAVEDYLRPSNNLPEWLIGVFFVMNIAGTSILGLTVLYYFVREKDRAFVELKQTQSRLIQAEKMASLGQLTAGIAHEIKNPLNFINNFSEMSVELADQITEELEENDSSLADAIGDLAANANRIHHHGMRIDGIVSSMMEHAQSKTGNPALTDINLLVEDYSRLVVAAVEAEHGDIELELDVSLDETLTPIKIVRQDLGRVVQNLVKNAAEAVIDHDVTEPIIRVSTRRDGKNIEVIISDNGPGVPDDIRDRIFEPFFTTKPTGQGTGLGLSLSFDTISQSFGGTLELGPSELGGATFVVRLLS